MAKGAAGDDGAQDPRITPVEKGAEDPRIQPVSSGVPDPRIEFVAKAQGAGKRGVDSADAAFGIRAFESARRAIDDLATATLTPRHYSEERARQDTASGTPWSATKGGFRGARAAREQSAGAPNDKDAKGHGEQPPVQRIIVPPDVNEPPVRFPEVEPTGWYKFALSEPSIGYAAGLPGVGGRLVASAAYRGSVTSGQPYVVPPRFRGGLPFGWGRSAVDDGSSWEFLGSDGRRGTVATFEGFPLDDPLAAPDARRAAQQSGWKGNSAIVADPQTRRPIVCAQLAWSDARFRNYISTYGEWANFYNFLPDMLVAAVSSDDGGAFSRTELVAHVPGGSVDLPDAVLAADGTLWVAWTQAQSGMRATPVIRIGTLEVSGLHWLTEPMPLEPLTEWNYSRIQVHVSSSGDYLLYVAVGRSPEETVTLPTNEFRLAEFIIRPGEWVPRITANVATITGVAVVAGLDLPSRRPVASIASDGRRLAWAYMVPRPDGLGTEVHVRSLLPSDLATLDARSSPTHVVRGMDDGVVDMRTAMYVRPKVASGRDGSTAVACYELFDGNVVPVANGALDPANSRAWDARPTRLTSPYPPARISRAAWGLNIELFNPDGWRPGEESEFRLRARQERQARGLPVPEAWELLNISDDSYLADPVLGDYLGLTWVPRGAPLARGLDGIFYCAWTEVTPGADASQIGVRRIEVR